MAKYIKHDKVTLEDFDEVASNEFKTKKSKKGTLNDKVINAFELYNRKAAKEPKLLSPFFQKVGLASVVGSSDVGKSSFLRQLALSVALGKEEFVDFKLHTKSSKVIFVSTEDDFNSTKIANKMQLSKLIDNDNELKKLENLDFIFDSDNLTKTLESVLAKKRLTL